MKRRRAAAALDAAALAAVLYFPPAASAQTAASPGLPRTIDVRARTVAFYPGGRLLLAANGDAAVRWRGFLLHADSVQIDLQGNALVAAGNVQLDQPGRHLEAAALRVDLPAKHAIALLVEPDPVTEGFALNASGAPVAAAAPDGTFALADTVGARPFIRGRRAVVTPNVNVRFTPAQFPTSSGFTAPSPSYMYTFSTNPNFAANALPYASFDQPYDLYGTPDSLTAAHFRYDSRLGAGVGIDQHFVFGQHAYVVASFTPLIGPQRIADLIARDDIGKKAFQQFIGSDGDGVQSGNYTLQRSFRSYSMNFATTETRAIGSSVAGTTELSLNSYQYWIGHVLSYKLHAGYGLDNNSLGLVYDGKQSRYNGLWRTTTETFVSSPTLAAPLRSTLFMSYDLQTKSYGFPHEQTTQTELATLSRSFRNGNATFLTLNGTASISTFSDHYGLLQQVEYPPPATPLITPDNVPWPGYAAFMGLSTSRTYSLDATFTPNPAFTAEMRVVHATDFPQYAGFGRPPYSLFADIRTRPAYNFGLEFGRTYNFNWANTTWVPQWVFAITQ